MFTQILITQFHIECQHAFDDFRSNRPFGFQQLKKKKSEEGSSGMTSVSKGFPKMHESSSVDEKRRKRPSTEDQCESPKSVVLPQKKRVLPPSSANSPAKKTQKTSSTSSDEGVADENLIRETEAALKNLSGSWPGPRGSSYKRQHEESPAFENLFDEKKANVKLSPSTSCSSSSETACSLKDVITLREQHEESDEKEMKTSAKIVKIKQEQIDDTSKTKIKAVIKPEPSYKPPDFNELVDDSSNELEIDMSEAASDKNEAKECDRQKEETKSRFPDDSSHVYHPFSRPIATTGSPFSSNSAFRPPQTKSSNLTNLGPYPAEATFVGYPHPTEPPPTITEDKSKPSLLKTDDPQSDSSVCSTVGVKSPETVNKHYTILQPAGAGSRAANVLQEAARDGVPSVSAVSSASSVSSTDTSVKLMAPTAVPGSLSPTSMGRGKYRIICGCVYGRRLCMCMCVWENGASFGGYRTRESDFYHEGL